MTTYGMDQELLIRAQNLATVWATGDRRYVVKAIRGNLPLTAAIALALLLEHDRLQALGFLTFVASGEQEPAIRSGKAVGGRARMALMTSKQRRDFARSGALARWGKDGKEP